MNAPPTVAAEARLQQIELARRAVMQEGRSLTDALVDQWYDSAWIERSWRRCLSHGQAPQQSVGFDVIPAQALRLEFKQQVLVDFGYRAIVLGAQL